MNKKIKICLIVAISVILVGIISFILYNHFNTNIEYRVKHFKHEEIDTLDLTKGEFYDDDSIDATYPFYYYAKKDVDYDGRYFIAKFMFPDEEVIIEENVFKNGGPNNPDLFEVESILYSKQEITEHYLDRYLIYVHNNPCGPVVKDFKELEDNYYYVKYKMADEC